MFMHFSSSVPGFINLQVWPKERHLYSEQGLNFSLHLSQSFPPNGAIHGLQIVATLYVLYFVVNMSIAAYIVYNHAAIFITSNAVLNVDDFAGFSAGGDNWTVSSNTP